MAMLFNYKKNRVWAENGHIIMYIGLTMAGCIIFCFFVGRTIDGWLGTKGIFMIIFTIFGIFGGAYTVYRNIMEMTEKGKKETSEYGNN